MKMNESNKFPSKDWKAGFLCAVDCYSAILNGLLYDLDDLEDNTFRHWMVSMIAVLMMEHRQDIHKGYYSDTNFLDINSPIIGIDKKYGKDSKIINWLGSPSEKISRPTFRAVYNPAFRDDTCVGDDGADE